MTLLGLIPVPGLLRRSGIVDAETERSSHRGAVPRGAGLVLFSAFLLAVAAGAVTSTWDDRLLVISAIVIVGSLMFVGLADDLGHVPIVVRLGLQFAIGSSFAFLASPTSVRVSFGWILFVFVGTVVVIIVNTVNFMDGINGISGVTGTIVAANYAALSNHADIADLALLAVCVAATTGGFLPHNVPRPRLFLGDSGSYYVGSSLAMLAVLLWMKGFSTIVVLAPLALYLSDVAFTLVERAKDGEILWEAHRRHRYQRLAAERLGHGRTTIYVGALTAVLCGAAWADRLGERPLAIAIVVAVIVVYQTMPRIAPASAR